MMNMNSQRWYKKGQRLLDEIAKTRTAGNEAHFWYLGQMGLAARLNNRIIWIDLVLNNFNDNEGVSTRAYPPPFTADSVIPGDYFFCTHGHIDHLDGETVFPLAKANPALVFVVPMPLRKVLVEAGIESSRVLGAREGEELSLQGITLLPVAAAHPDYQKDEAGDDFCLGYVLTGAGVRLYHAGDTMVTLRLVETLKALGPMDAAIIPINGGDWERTAQDIIGNMTVEDAVKLCRAVPVDLAIPAHYDMIRGNTENPAAFTDYLYSLCPEKKHHVFALGERYCYMK
jgi:L-ascorbate metabolism protein UlaG (beta-lactamase superfamily)